MRFPTIDLLKCAVRDSLRKWLDKSGACEPGVGIYCYHGLVQKGQDKQLERNFRSVSDFREHVQFFRRHGVMALDDLTHSLAQGDGSDRRRAVITFDDGYANNLLAAEILAEAKLPWCLFVSTAAMGRQKAIWPVELSLLLLLLFEHFTMAPFELLKLSRNVMLCAAFPFLTIERCCLVK